MHMWPGVCARVWLCTCPWLRALRVCPSVFPRWEPGRTRGSAEIRVGKSPTAPRWLQGLGSEVSSLSWRLISPGEDALIPVTHSLGKFKAARWREAVWDCGFQSDSLILL